jgi:hypothetical protein
MQYPYSNREEFEDAIIRAEFVRDSNKLEFDRAQAEVDRLVADRDQIVNAVIAARAAKKPDDWISCACPCNNGLQFMDFGNGNVDLIVDGKRGSVCVVLSVPELTALKALIEEALASAEEEKGETHD